MLVWILNHLKDIKRLSLTSDQTQADQGSEVNLMSRELAHDKGMRTFRLSDVGFGGLKILTSDGNKVPVDDFVALKVTCQGIVREVWAIIRPAQDHRPEGCDLFLGLPWLWEVDAVFNIRSSTLEIGDQERGETRSSLLWKAPD